MALSLKNPLSVQILFEFLYKNDSFRIVCQFLKIYSTSIFSNLVNSPNIGKFVPNILHWHWNIETWTGSRASDQPGDSISIFNFTSIFSNLAGLLNNGKFVQEIHQRCYQTISASMASWELESKLKYFEKNCIAWKIIVKKWILSVFMIIL